MPPWFGRIRRSKPSPEPRIVIMLTPEEAFQFDLQGYVVLRGVLDRERLLAVGAEVAAFDDAGNERLPWSIPVWTPVINEYRVLNILDPVPSTLEYVDHEQIHQRVASLLDAPFRLTEAYSITRGPGIGLYLHHIPEPVSSYRVEGGQPRCTYVKVNVPLADCGPDDGPFCVIEGSHKSQVAYPWSKLDPDWEPATKDLHIVEMMEGHEQGRPKRDWNTVPGFRELPTQVGDVVIFTESLLHGARKIASGMRRRGLYFGNGAASCANWHGVQYSPELLSRATARQQQLIGGPHVGFRYQSTPPELAPRRPRLPVLPELREAVPRVGASLLHRLRFDPYPHVEDARVLAVVTR